MEGGKPRSESLSNLANIFTGRRRRGILYLMWKRMQVKMDSSGTFFTQSQHEIVRQYIGHLS
jgi:hypothetical protein